jgi:DNA-binding IclR family transcriptional regulator
VRLFGLLGDAAPVGFGQSAAAQLAGLPMRQTRALLAELTEAHLIDPAGDPGHFRLHPLLRAYAQEMGQT